jgi:predicted amidohydrolase
MKPALTDERQRRLARVINLALDAAKQGKSRPTLLVLPELSLPRRWWRQVCAHLARSEPMVSLVAGLEYDVVEKKVYNEAMAYFPRPFFSAAMWTWTKRRPANHEASKLHELGYAFSKRAEHLRFVRVRSEHGYFLPLICSELLEVDSRTRLLNRVDFVLIPAWNKDTTSFEYLVHASALELHSFIAVANNGFYSDCRIRGPYGEPAWQREVCRLIDRESDEVVAAMIPVHHLREFRADPDTYSKKIEAWTAAAKSARAKIKLAKKEKKKPKFTNDEVEVLTPDRTDVMTCPWPEWKPLPPGDAWPGSEP